MTNVQLSDKATAISSLWAEMSHIEKAQLEVGEEMAILLYRQVGLSEKFRALRNTMEALIK